MRTPDSDDSGGEAGSLADGFGDDDIDLSGPDASAYGDGWSADSYDDSGAVGTYGDSDGSIPVDDVDTGLDGSDPPSPFDMEPGDIVTDTDLDVTGDGVIDGADFHEAATAIFDFGVDHHDDAQGALHHHHVDHDGFGIFDA
ncbi:MAG TPA: hypothetical protein VF743_10115 [Acidimicrobiales bacterium]